LWTADNPLWRIGDDKGTLMLIHIEKGLKRVYNLVQKITELLSESGILIFIFLHTYEYCYRPISAGID